MIFGYLREHSDKCKNDKKYTYTGLDVYLKIIFPEINDWIHDKIIPNTKINGKTLRKRPDYRSESLKMIVEFDGIQHYQNPIKVISDGKNTEIYESLGYKVVRIPFFIQLTRKTITRFFNVDVRRELFDENVPSFGVEWENTPAFMCYSGIERTALELAKHPEQLEVNIKSLEDIKDERLSGVSLLRNILKQNYMVLSK